MQARILIAILTMSVLAGAGAISAQGVSSAAMVGALLRPGAPVFGTTGAVLGNVASIGDREVVLTTPAGPVTVLRGSFGPSAKGLFFDRTTMQIAAIARQQAANPGG